MTVAEREMPESARRLVVLARFDALIFLYYGVLWAGGAASLATVIARRALGEVEGSAVLAAASSVSHHSLMFTAVFTPVALILVGATGVRSAYNTSKDIKEARKTLHQVAQMMLKDPLIVGALILLVFLPLIRHDDLVVGLLAVERSEGTCSFSIEGCGFIGCRRSIVFHHVTHYSTEAVEDEVEGYVDVLLRHNPEWKV